MEANREEQPWMLRIAEEFELINPAGAQVKLPTRKTEALLAMLVAVRPAPLMREEVGYELWPEKSKASRQASLRQSIAKLKTALPGAIVANRRQCGLSSTFKLEVASEQVAAKAVSRVFPERKRLVVSIEKEASVEVANSPVENLSNLVSWFAVHDPRKAIDMLRQDRELAKGIPSQKLKHITDIAETNLKPGELAYGWCLYWKAMWEINFVDASVSRALFRRALQVAINHSDDELKMECAFMLGIAEILLAKLTEAEHISHLCTKMAERSTSPTLQGRVYHLAGTLLAHQGKIGEGLRHMERASALTQGSIFEHANVELMRALYHTTIREIDEAEDLVSLPERIASQADHQALLDISRFIRAFIELNKQHWDEASYQLDRLLERMTRTGMGHVAIYGSESLAIAAWKRRDREGAAKHLGTATRLRKEFKLGYTGWDRRRLEALTH